ncbi:hypothetical protein C8R43DRAFT_1176563 [Mycena crocata]|nr:hypothetical protein C8R43DRAFT_1176563 [Mycena crocata]
MSLSRLSACPALAAFLPNRRPAAQSARPSLNAVPQPAHPGKSYTYTAYSQTSPSTPTSQTEMDGNAPQAHFAHVSTVPREDCTFFAQPTPPHFALNLRHPQFASSRARLVAANSRPACLVRLGTSLVAARPHLKHTNAKHDRTEHREYGTTESVRAVASPAPIPRAQHRVFALHGLTSRREILRPRPSIQMGPTPRANACMLPCIECSRSGVHAPDRRHDCLPPSARAAPNLLYHKGASLPNQLGCLEADWAGMSSSVSHFSWREICGQCPCATGRVVVESAQDALDAMAARKPAP